MFPPPLKPGKASHGHHTTGDANGGKSALKSTIRPAFASLHSLPSLPRSTPSPHSASASASSALPSPSSSEAITVHPIMRPLASMATGGTGGSHDDLNTASWGNHDRVMNAGEHDVGHRTARQLPALSLRATAMRRYEICRLLYSSRVGTSEFFSPICAFILLFSDSNAFSQESKPVAFVRDPCGGGRKSGRSLCRWRCGRIYRVCR
jgi:hypothetical protein